MVISLKKYVTISIPMDVKKRLEKLKGNMEWGAFLLKLCEEYERCVREKAFRELIELFDEVDLESIEASMKEFRRHFKLREEG